MKTGIYMRFKSNRVAAASLIFIIFVSVIAGLASYISPYTQDGTDSTSLLKTPSASHLMGTDRLGRDLLTRVLYGARISLVVGLSVSLAALFIGTIYGALSGFLGGKPDNIMMRFVDVLYSIPDLLLIILISIFIGQGLAGIILSLSLVSWVTVARLIRGEVLRLKEQPFIEAVQELGASRMRIIFRHLLPNTLGPLIVTLTFRIPQAILAESTLSFLGLGIPPPSSSWGTLANEGWSSLKFYPHLILFPSVMIFLTILSFNFFGDGLRDAFDPEMYV